MVEDRSPWTAWQYVGMVPVTLLACILGGGGLVGCLFLAVASVLVRAAVLCAIWPMACVLRSITYALQSGVGAIQAAKERFDALVQSARPGWWSSLVWTVPLVAILGRFVSVVAGLVAALFSSIAFVFYGPVLYGFFYSGALLYLTTRMVWAVVWGVGETLLTLPAALLQNLCGAAFALCQAGFWDVRRAVRVFWYTCLRAHPPAIPPPDQASPPCTASSPAVLSPKLDASMTLFQRFWARCVAIYIMCPVAGWPWWMQCIVRPHLVARFACQREWVRLAEQTPSLEIWVMGQESKRTDCNSDNAVQRPTDWRGYLRQWGVRLSERCKGIVNQTRLASPKASAASPLFFCCLDSDTMLPLETDFFQCILEHCPSATIVAWHAREVGGSRGRLEIPQQWVSDAQQVIRHWQVKHPSASSHYIGVGWGGWVLSHAVAAHESVCAIVPQRAGFSIPSVAAKGAVTRWALGRHWAEPMRCGNSGRLTLIKVAATGSSFFRTWYRWVFGYPLRTLGQELCSSSPSGALGEFAQYVVTPSREQNTPAREQAEVKPENNATVDNAKPLWFSVSYEEWCKEETKSPSPIPETIVPSPRPSAVR